MDSNGRSLIAMMSRAQRILMMSLNRDQPTLLQTDGRQRNALYTTPSKHQFLARQISLSKDYTRKRMRPDTEKPPLKLQGQHEKPADFDPYELFVDPKTPSISASDDEVADLFSASPLSATGSAKRRRETEGDDASYSTEFDARSRRAFFDMSRMTKSTPRAAECSTLMPDPYDYETEAILYPDETMVASSVKVIGNEFLIINI